MAKTVKVEVYSSPFCSYCHRAKRLLQNKGVDFAEYDVIATPSLREDMVKRAGGRQTVPQIFIDGTHVGGCDDLMSLEAEGKLDPLLGTHPA